VIHTLINLLASTILNAIRHFGYTGITALMAIESACIPIPSEVIMTFSGYLVSMHAMSLWGITLAGTLGSLIGSLIAYALGAYGGLPFLQRYGRYLLISHHDLERAHAWFTRYGPITVFIGRLLPILRTFISLPAGVGRMPILPFILYSTAGSALWCAGLGWIGLRLGQHWQALSPYMHRIDDAIAIGLVVFFLIVIARHRNRRPNT
jgi:membrane protein DedA with SNARE-associated domain